MTTHKNIHPMQRFTVHMTQSRAPVEFIGQLEYMDVFWLPDRGYALIKFSSVSGDSAVLKPDGTLTASYAVKRANLLSTPETKDLILAMCRCFAQTNRPPEWNEEVVYSDMLRNR